MNPYELASRYLGTRERPGAAFDPFIAAWILDAGGPSTLNDETPWCGAFVYHVAHRLLGLEAPAEPLRARAWLTVGEDIITNRGDVEASFPPRYWTLAQRFARCERGDVVVLSRGPLPQPGPEVELAPGHVGFLASEPGPTTDQFWLLSGNVADAVTISAFPISRVLGVRRLRPARG